VGEEVHHNYLQLAQSLEEFVGKMFTDWTNSVERELDKLLETPLMLRISKYTTSCIYPLCVFV